MDVTQRAWQPGLALKHQMQFLGSCCSIYWQSQSEEVLSGIHLCTCLLQWGYRNDMEEGELGSAFLWPWTGKGNNKFYFLLITLLPNYAHTKSHKTHTCVYTHRGKEYGRRRRAEDSHFNEDVSRYQTTAFREEVIRSRRTGLSLHCWDGAKGWGRSIREKRFGERCRRGMLCLSSTPSLVWGFVVLASISFWMSLRHLPMKFWWIFNWSLVTALWLDSVELQNFEV